VAGRDPHAVPPEAEAGAAASGALLVVCVVFVSAWSAALAVAWAAVGTMLLLAVQLSVSGLPAAAAASRRGCWIDCWP
jgi:hypothetical protein